MTCGASAQIECPMPGTWQSTTGWDPQPLVWMQSPFSAEVVVAAGGGISNWVPVQLLDGGAYVDVPQFAALPAHPFAVSQYDSASSALHGSTVPSESPWMMRAGTAPVVPTH
jgi:hypothetical protein